MTSNRKILVGAFVLGGFVLFALGLFWIGDRRLLFSESLELETEFAHLSGLKVGSKVMVSGMDAGEVLAVHVPTSPEGKFRVRFRVLSRFQPMLRSDSVASIQVEGLVGSKVLQIEAGSSQGAQVRPGLVLPSREPVEIAAVIQQSVEVINKVSGAVDDVQERAVRVIGVIGDVGDKANTLVTEVGKDVDEILGTGKKVVRGVDGIVDGVQQGRGLVGKLLTDDQLYASVASTVKNVETASASVNQTAAGVRRVVGDIESRNLGELLQKTATNVEQATAGVKEVVAELRPSGGPEQRGLLDDVRDTLTNTRRATAGLADNMDALRHNWFFRGYFNRRGFFDLESLSPEEYRKGRIAAGRPQERVWLHAAELFRREASGRETLSEEGRRRIDEAVAPYLPHAPNTLLIVEGYAGAGSPAEQYLVSRQRARLVREYLAERFGLNPSFLGAVPMGAVRSSGASGVYFEGAALVYFPDRK